jgi:hypothetical protein
MNLELMAMRWLWLEKKCNYVLTERTPRYGIGQPDVLGVTKPRYLIEIEIKRSYSDFLADSKKRHRQHLVIKDNWVLKHSPKQIYYLMPAELAERCEHLIPSWAGLMRPSPNTITLEVVKMAPVNSQSDRLTIRECIWLARAMCNNMMSVELKLQNHMNNFKHRDDTTFIDWSDPLTGTYEI